MFSRCVLAFFMIVCANISTRSQQGVSAIKTEDLRYYEFVDVHEVRSNRGHVDKNRREADDVTVDFEDDPDVKTFTFHGFGRSFKMNLHQNAFLMTSSFLVSYKERFGASPVNCYYQGYLEDRSTSNVVISTCRGVDGVLRDQDGETLQRYLFFSF